MHGVPFQHVPISLQYTLYIYKPFIPYIHIFSIYLSNTCNIAVQVHVLVFRSISTPSTPPPLSYNIFFALYMYMYMHCIPSMSGCSVLVFQAVLWRQRETQTQWQNDSNTCIMSHVLVFGICNQRKLISIMLSGNSSVLRIFLFQDSFFYWLLLHSNDSSQCIFFSFCMKQTNLKSGISKKKSFKVWGWFWYRLRLKIYYMYTTYMEVYDQVWEIKLNLIELGKCQYSSNMHHCCP